MNTETQSADEIRREMAQIRHEIDEDINGVVANAQLLTDWTWYVRAHPVATAAAAAAVGYLAVPAKQRIVSPDAKTVEKLARQNKIVVRSKPEPQKQGGVAGALFTLASGAIVRGLVGYMSQQVGKVISPERTDHASPAAGAAQPSPGNTTEESP